MLNQGLTDRMIRWVCSIRRRKFISILLAFALLQFFIMWYNLIQYQRPLRGKMVMPSDDSDWPPIPP
ncbi:hypothetical protein PROFUN_14725 [Planoprotostelium fungivorum]|uniref:Uncharacterized protein n=1 Tax=Planoprotostelium fungivorum TaxID=1890364 RepID=A0A2P6N252_9EUKA|nr:hypothetical protein PROFUN_14725 [Planoprotostelium fungivorum]